MSLIEVVLSGVILGGLYALIAIGFNLQYGVARIFNLAYGEFLMAAAFAAFWMFTLVHIDPVIGMMASVPVTFAANWLVYKVLMLPLVRRARTRDDLEGDTFLSFNPAIGVEFTMKALVVVMMGGVGNMLGSLVAGVLLGVAESLCSYFIDSGLTLAVAYVLFLIVLLVRPRGLFGTP